MRPILHGDVVAAARALYALPEVRRAQALDGMLRTAARADTYRLWTGRVHPRWGDGSLMVTALGRRPPPEPPLNDTDYCGCMAMVFEALVGWLGRDRQPNRLRN
ncbi:MAG: hypothetical protein LJE68_03850 [Rhodobacter sp.]|nr:hypothetical protein [Rhodobacter sp.]